MTRSVGLGLVLLLFAGPSHAAHRAKLRPPAHGLQVRLSSFTIKPGREREVCQVIRLPNRKAMDVRAITIAMPYGADYTSHHFAIFLYGGDDPDSREVSAGAFDAPGCAGVGGEIVSPILAFVQRPRQRIRLPRRVGFALRPQQYLLLNSHYLNAAATPLTVDVAVNLHAARKGSIRHHVRSFQLGTFNIAVPPGQPGSATASWDTPFPMNLVWLSSHSHKHTQSAGIELLRAGAAAGEELRTIEYAEPAVRQYHPPLRLEAGDGFRWTCNYLNTTNRLLTFGLTSDDEMCFAVGFFYPDDDAAPLPPVRGCFGKGDGLVCPGN